jgi:hypothetical protein
MVSCSDWHRESACLSIRPPKSRVLMKGESNWFESVRIWYRGIVWLEGVLRSDERSATVRCLRDATALSVDARRTHRDKGKHTEQRSQFSSNDEYIGVNKVLTYSFPAHWPCLLTSNDRYIDKDSPQAPISTSSESSTLVNKGWNQHQTPQ